jgi:hypothetical protein
MKFLMVGALVLIGCCDSTGPKRDVCLQAKLDFIREWYGPEYSPTPQLLQQNQFNLGNNAYVIFTPHVDSDACQVTLVR